MKLSIYKAKPDKSIREHTDELLENLKIMRKLGYIKNERIYNLAGMACEYHDYGKVNSQFQKRIRSGAKFNENIEISHNILSLYFIDPNKFNDIMDYYKVGFAVLNHHDYCNNLRAIENSESKDLINELLSNFDTFPITRRTSNNLWKISEDTETILIKGLLHRCDYSASAGNIVEYKNDFLKDGLNALLNTWKDEDPTASWNELQEFCKNNTDNNIIAIAQTGMGKTEAGLHWIGNNKGFFILPLKTAINAIYERIQYEILYNKQIEKRLAILHSDALSYHVSNNEEMDIMDYHNNSRQFSIPLNISTADQLFDFIFKYQGYELKLATLSYSKVVIDEIQMYSPDILAFLISGIRRINELGGKVAILTATLAPFIRDLFSTENNPMQFAEATFTNDLERHHVKIIDDKINAKIICDKFLDNQARGLSNKILVVCNTVRKAQEIYNELIAKGLENVNILHGKFIKHERSNKEKEIIKFGETENIATGIWVTTQIVEASLDIDFDYLFTELSDINGLFQRLGRCNRKGIKSVMETNCFVFINIDKNLLTNGNKGFIDRRIYKLSKEALMNEDINGLLTEKKKIDIINKYLTTEKLKGSDYLIKYNQFLKWIECLNPYEIDKKDVRFRNIISFDVIPESVYEENHEEIDKNSILLMNPRTDKLKKIRLKEEIKKYVVPVGIYDINIRGKTNIIKNVRLSSNQFIHVVKCQYDELGFRRLSRDIDEDLSKEANYDNFF